MISNPLDIYVAKDTIACTSSMHQSMPTHHLLLLLPQRLSFYIMQCLQHWLWWFPLHQDTRTTSTHKSQQTFKVVRNVIDCQYLYFLMSLVHAVVTPTTSSSGWDWFCHWLSVVLHGWPMLWLHSILFRAPWTKTIAMVERMKRNNMGLESSSLQLLYHCCSVWYGSLGV